MPPARRTGQPYTILFGDLSGSAELYETVGNARAHAAIVSTLHTLSRSIERNRGDVVKTVGAELMCIFSSPVDAANAAVDMQHCATQPAMIDDMSVKPLALRVGFHHGPVISEGTDVFGDAVNLAARVLAHAKQRQILLTKEAAERLPSDIQGSIRSVGIRQVKGKLEPVELFEIVWEREDVTLARRLTAGQPEPICLIATFGTTTIRACSSRPVLRIGRDQQNDLVVSDPSASRVHARIELRRNRIFLVDQSLNGTYLRAPGKPEIVVRRDEVELESSGVMSFGKSTLKAQDLCMHFALQKDMKRA